MQYNIFQKIINVGINQTTKVGVTKIYNKNDGSLIFNGTATANYIDNLILINLEDTDYLKAGNKYYIHWTHNNKELNNSVKFHIYSYLTKNAADNTGRTDVLIDAKMSYKIPEDCKCILFRIELYGNKTYNNFKIYPIINNYIENNFTIFKYDDLNDWNIYTKCKTNGEILYIGGQDPMPQNVPSDEINLHRTGLVINYICADVVALQVYIVYQNTNIIYLRTNLNNVWSSWKRISTQEAINIATDINNPSANNAISQLFIKQNVMLPKYVNEFIHMDQLNDEQYIDLDELIQPGYYIFETSMRKDNAPGNNNGKDFNALTVENFSASNYTFIKQTIFNITSSSNYDIVKTTQYSRIHNNANWGTWGLSAGGSTGIINNNTNNWQYDVHKDTYNITASPIISLTQAEYYLTPSGDYTDRTDDIEILLNNIGYCKLAPGDYYITKGISMPDKTCISGCGPQTRLILTENIQSGYIISMGSYCIVQDIKCTGKIDGDIAYDNTSLTDRVGILLLGDATGFAGGTTFSANFCKLNNLWIENLGSGIRHYRNNGGSSFLASNIDILHCGIGLNIELFSEFSSYTNIRMRWCIIACVMNGGNNLISNAHFDVCKMLVKIDNSLGNLINDTHSAFTNCTFCHADNNNGDALWISGVNNGLSITNCTFFYSRIYIENSSAIGLFNNIICNTQKFEFINAKGINISNNIMLGTHEMIKDDQSVIIWNNNVNKSGAIVSM